MQKILAKILRSAAESNVIRLHLSTEQRHRLAEIISVAGQLPPKPMRGARIVAALLAGESPSLIAAREGITTANVTATKKQAAADPEKFLRRFENAAAKRIKSKSPPAKSGAKGITTFSEWIRSLPLTELPVVDIANILITPQTRCIVLLLRNDYGFSLDLSKGSMRLGGERFKLDCSQDPIGRTWTNLSVFDAAMAAMHQQANRIATELSWYRQKSVKPMPCGPIDQRFAGKPKVMIFKEGDPEELELYLRDVYADERIGSARAVVDYQGDWITLFQLVIYRLRSGPSIPGLLPSLWDVVSAMLNWRRNRNRCFAWSGTEALLQQRLGPATISWHLHAAHGVMFDLIPSLWSGIAYSGSANQKASRSIRPKVFTVPDHRTRSEAVAVEILPGLECAFPAEVGSSPHDAATKLRRHLRASNRGLRFVYANPLDENGVTADLFEPWPTPFEDSGSRGLPPAPKKLDSRLEVKVTLVPRHELTQSPDVPLEFYESAAANIADVGTWIRPRPDGEDRFLVFHYHNFGDDYNEALKQNRYGPAFDNLRYLRSAIGNLNADKEAPYHTSAYPGALEFNAARCDLPSSAHLRKLWQLPFETDIVHHYGKAIELPGFMLVEFDADFILRGFSADAKSRLRSLTKKWQTKVWKLIREKYWQRDGTIRVTELEHFLPNGGKSHPQIPADSLGDWANDALNAFSESSWQIVRGAIETMQFLYLMGVKPIAIALRTPDQILRAWRRYLRSVLASRLAEMASEQIGARSLASTPTGSLTSFPTDLSAQIIAPLITTIFRLWSGKASAADIETLCRDAHAADRGEWRDVLGSCLAVELEAQKVRRLFELWQLFHQSPAPQDAVDEIIARSQTEIRRILFSEDH